MTARAPSPRARDRGRAHGGDEGDGDPGRGSGLTSETSIRSHVSDRRARVRVAGALDLATRDRFLTEVEASLDADLLELDLRDLEYVDSTGLSAIIQANRRSEAEIGRRARLLIAEDGPVRRMLELTLLHLTLDVRVA